MGWQTGKRSAEAKMVSGVRWVDRQGLGLRREIWANRWEVVLMKTLPRITCSFWIHSKVQNRSVKDMAE